MSRNKNPPYVNIRPAELMAEIMRLRDPECACMLLQIRHEVLIYMAPIPLDYKHLGNICGLSRLRAQKVIHKLLHSYAEPDIYETGIGLVSSHKADNLLENWINFCKKSGKTYGLPEVTEKENVNNQEVKNTYVGNTVPYQRYNNLKPLPGINNRAREGRAGDCFTWNIAEKMMDAARVVLRMDDLDTFHLKTMMEMYPNRSRVDMLALFNAWVIGEQNAGKMGAVSNPAALLMTWLKKSTWLAKEDMRA